MPYGDNSFDGKESVDYTKVRVDTQSSRALSLPIAVRTDVLVVRADALSAGRILLNFPTSSAEMCWASAALPPFPKKTTFRPFSSAVVIMWAISMMSLRHSLATRSFVSILFRIAASAADASFFSPTDRLGPTGLFCIVARILLWASPGLQTFQVESDWEGFASETFDRSFNVNLLAGLAV